MGFRRMGGEERSARLDTLNHRCPDASWDRYGVARAPIPAIAPGEATSGELSRACSPISVDPAGPHQVTRQRSCSCDAHLRICPPPAGPREQQGPNRARSARLFAAFFLCAARTFSGRSPFLFQHKGIGYFYNILYNDGSVRFPTFGPPKNLPEGFPRKIHAIPLRMNL